jgi:hypothetical protein
VVEVLLLAAMKKPKPLWQRHRNKEARAHLREKYVYDCCPEFRPQEHYWELSEDYAFAVSADAPVPDRGDLSELLKLQLARAFQCEQVIRDKLKSFRLDGEDRIAITEIAARFAGDLKNKNAGDHSQEKTTEKTILRLSLACAFAAFALLNL